MAKTDAISSASKSVLVPTLSSLGFVAHTDRLICRIVDDILQFLSVNASSRGSQRFRIQYASLCLFRPREDYSLCPGGTLGPEGKGRSWLRIFNRTPDQSWFPGSSLSEANSSMLIVQKLLEKEALPFFEATRTIGGLVTVLERERWGSQHHLQFEIGCCLAKLGNYSQARIHLEKSLQEYEKDGREWCAREARYVHDLLAALEHQKSGEVLDEWNAYSVNSLKLESVIRA